MSSSTMAPRSWLRTWSPRSATSSATARIASDRVRSGPAATAGPNSVGNIARQPSGSVVSPFITARARTRWAGVASASSVGRAGRRAGPPGSPRRRPRDRRAPRPGTSRRSPSADAATTCGNVDSQSMARCGSVIRPISSMARVDGVVGDRVDAGSRRAPPRRPRVARATRSARSLTYVHSSSISSPSSVSSA